MVYGYRYDAMEFGLVKARKGMTDLFELTPVKPLLQEVADLVAEEHRTQGDSPSPEDDSAAATASALAIRCTPTSEQAMAVMQLDWQCSASNPDLKEHVKIVETHKLQVEALVATHCRFIVDEDRRVPVVIFGHMVLVCSRT